MPTITIDKTDGCQMYLSKDSMDVEIVSSKSSEMNVLIPKANGEYVSILYLHNQNCINECYIFHFIHRKRLLFIVLIARL